MNQGFKFKFNEMREGNPAQSDGQEENKPGHPSDVYPAAGHNRNLCFAWPDGKRKFLNYAYLVSADYSPDEDKIDLEFTTHAVVLKGLRLSTLYDALMEQLPKFICCMEARYNDAADADLPLVNEINIINMSI